MSSILEALKKLEAEKQSPAPVEPDPVHDAAFGGGALLGEVARPTAPQRSTAPLLWVLGGGMFTLMVIGVVVLLMIFFLQRDQIAPSRAAGSRPAETPAPARETPATPAEAAASTREPNDTSAVAATELEDPPPAAPAPAADNEQPADTPGDIAMVTTPVAMPDSPPEEASVPDPPAPAPAPEPVPPRPEPAPEPPATVRAEPPAPAPPVSETLDEPLPLPEDIRDLPMLSRSARSQYRLEGIQLNMLNAAGPTRPLGNAFINLEKVFVGEFLPGTNARLVDVTSHGIAIEIQSTRQRYYIPR